MGDLFTLSGVRWCGLRRISHCRMAFRGSMIVARRAGSVYVIIHNGLQWKDAPKDYGPHKTFYNRFIRWSRLGVIDGIFAGLAGQGPEPERIMIDATHLKAHRTAASLFKKGLFPVVSGAPKLG